MQGEFFCLKKENWKETPLWYNVTTLGPGQGFADGLGFQSRWACVLNPWACLVQPGGSLLLQPTSRRLLPKACLLFSGSSRQREQLVVLLCDEERCAKLASEKNKIGGRGLGEGKMWGAIAERKEQEVFWELWVPSAELKQSCGIALLSGIAVLARLQASLRLLAGFCVHCFGDPAEQQQGKRVLWEMLPALELLVARAGAIFKLNSCRMESFPH